MRIASVHIPKTGGLTFRSHLINIYGKKNVIFDYNHVDNPDHKTETYIPGPVLKWFRQPARTTVVHGHFHMSKYRCVPALQRVMFFRDPIQRLLSHYYYWQRASDFNHPLCIKLLEEGLSVLEFAKLDGLRNYFTMYLDGVTVDEMDFIGLVEEFDDSLKLFHRMYAINKPVEFDTHENRNCAKPKQKYQIDDGLHKKLEKLNEADMELYKQAKERYKDLKVRYWGGY